MSSLPTVEIAINGAFITRRWEQPDNWMRLTRETGFPAHSFCGDVLDPFFSGDRAFQQEQAAAVKEAAKNYGVTICDYYTGVATHRFHGLSHSDARARERMADWIMEAALLAVEMGTDLLGGHWDAFSCEVLADPQATESAMQRMFVTFRDLASRLRSTGIRALMQEQMYIPSEKPWTIAECEEFLIKVNAEKGDSIPVICTLDVGHMAGMHYGLKGRDLDYLEWLRQFGACSEVIHLQQTTADASHHWPFTSEFNAKGDISIEKTLEAVRESHRNYANSPVSRVLPTVSHHWLVAELIPGSTKTEDKILNELKETSKYLREYIPEGGLQL